MRKRGSRSSGIIKPTPEWKIPVEISKLLEVKLMMIIVGSWYCILYFYYILILLITFVVMFLGVLGTAYCLFFRDWSSF